MTGNAAEKQVLAPCSSCVRETRHRVLFETHTNDEDRVETFVMLQCAGCSTISMGRQTRFLDDGDVEHTYYPSPCSRKKPSWLMSLSLANLFGEHKDVEGLGRLLTEVYEAVDGGQLRLAAMGIRALLEQIMVAKVGDLKTFDAKLDAFQSAGYISLLQRDAMKETLELGHAAMHRSFNPNAQELGVALDIVEGIFAAIFDHAGKSSRLTQRVPPRAKR